MVPPSDLYITGTSPNTDISGSSVSLRFTLSLKTSNINIYFDIFKIFSTPTFFMIHGVDILLGASRLLCKKGVVILTDFFLL